ncbi:hypothetical protein LTR62_004049 [Meristemomyces frigidus]|uniref:Uncharacterized protein n=1 Tax=Meristemomyces frigidus TaxID=1508187 RepID=A0AAN7TRC5_9PEZI|nr:hypothetical protein LTR62_004049 [Meristemomyces frigidus]
MRGPLPVDIYDPLESTHPACSAREFKGGIGMVMVVRYFDTPVGEYDELVVIPGNFAVPGGPEKGQEKLRVTRIYVNQRETTYNALSKGRRNWNIPKHLARFEFSSPPLSKTASPPKAITVTVWPPADYKVRTEIPFFKATFTPMSWTPSFPLSTSYLPISSHFVQPPLPSSDDDPALTGTETWKSYDVSSWSNRAKMVWVRSEQGRDVVARGWCPKFTPWSLGVVLLDAEMVVGEAREWTV